MISAAIRRAHARVVFSITLGLVTGCVLTIEPIVLESDALEDARLLGVWEDVSGADRLAISPAAGRDYTLEFVSAGETGIFRARLGTFGGRTIADLWPTPGEKALPAPYQGLLIAGHTVADIEISSDELRVRFLRDESLKEVLRGATDEIRGILTPRLRDTGAFDAPAVFRRRPSTPTRSTVVSCFEAEPWLAADALFHRDPRWVGGDAASSVDLGNGRVLWLFGDSWIDTSGGGTRQGARMVSNTVAIQTGTDPTQATMRFFWGKATDGGPAPIIPDEGPERRWFGNGVRVGNRLVLFLNRVRSTNTGLGFESITWEAWMVENPDADPDSWSIHRLTAPTNPLGVLLGFGGLYTLDGFVYAFGAAEPVPSHPIYMARWPVTAVERGDLMNPEWWGGEASGWVAEASSTPRQPIVNNGQSEVSVHRDSATQRFMLIVTQGFGAADIVMRSAPTLTGPWSAPGLVIRPPEFSRRDVMIYAAKAHSEQTGADLVLTYATNAFDFSELMSDPTLYFPRFVRLTRCQ